MAQHKVFAVCCGVLGVPLLIVIRTSYISLEIPIIRSIERLMTSDMSLVISSFWAISMHSG